ncbi:Enterochelin esterase [Corynebacterium provencense]|uniref:Enterochelin esterase n=1 Tax=Corynebacterium provencense TaxID=1737425 RepID=A0A2Z3YR30_9CORY|nr:alpha/beta hydrolase-fold protein [Corynebacterium provencense]AWT27442.1 Enterochelin esterase [Corynebacterium provencense]
MSGPDFLPPLPPRVHPTAVFDGIRDTGGVNGFFADLESRGGILVRDDPGSDTATVAFARRVRHPDESVVVLFDTITHMLRDRLDHFTLARYRVDGTEVHAGAFVLPRGLRATTSLLVERDLDPAIARDRGSWHAVYARTTALSGATEVLTTLEGGQANCLVLPGAPTSPFLPPQSTGERSTVGVTGTAPGTLTSEVIDSRALGRPMRLHAAFPPVDAGPVTAAVIVADGDRLVREFPFPGALRRAERAGFCAPTAALLFTPVDPEARGEVLGCHPGLPGFLEHELLPWARRHGPVPGDPRRLAVAGASLGGLAAADVVRQIPDAVGNAVVQSGSFWWPGPDGREGLPLRQWDRDGAELVGRVRVVQEVGTLEGHLRSHNRAFRDILRASGVDVTYREYVGGHDYSCWRVGLLDAIGHLFPGVDRAVPSPHTNGPFT